METRALRSHKDIIHGEMVSPRATHAPDMPGVKQLGLRRRHEQVELLGLTVLEPELAVLEDLRARREPGGMPATGAESLAAGDPVSARHYDCLSCRKRCVRDDAAWRVDPDQTSDVTRHARSISREDRALIDDPAGAVIGFPDLLEHLHVCRQVHMRAPHVT